MATSTGSPWQAIPYSVFPTMAIPEVLEEVEEEGQFEAVMTDLARGLDGWEYNMIEDWELTHSQALMVVPLLTVNSQSTMS